MTRTEWKSLAAVALSVVAFFALSRANLDAQEGIASETSAASSFDPVATEAGTRRVATINGVEIAFRYCPPGEFLMGCPDKEPWKYADETPRKVVLSRGFWLQETELTQAQWKAAGVDPDRRLREDDLPVYVSWNKCQRFISKLNEELKIAPEGWRFALPTEAQWEYACRAGTTGPLYGPFDKIAWGLDKLGSSPRPVGTKEANAWGFYDTIGNAPEWVADYYALYSAVAETDPTGPAVGALRVVRGGGDKEESSYRASRRDYAPDRVDYISFGARIALVPITDDASSVEETKKSAAKARVSLYELADKSVLWGGSSRSKESRKLKRLNPAQIERLDPEPAEPGTRRVMTIDGVAYPFRYCPPGEFAMGSPEDERGRLDNETLHNVALTKGFWIMETELTRAQWLPIALMILPPEARERDAVSSLSWNECQELIAELNENLKAAPEGWRFALPTEAQWEYACRAGTTGARYGELDQIARYAGSDDDDNERRVGRRFPNAWGLFDMLGNLSEWCEDRFGDYPIGDAIDPTGPATGSERVVRGGSKVHSGAGCRCARRYSLSPDSSDYAVGTRFVLVPATESEPAVPSEVSRSDAVENSTFDPVATEPGTRRVARFNGVEFPFRYCPPKSLKIGADEDEIKRLPLETTLSPGFWLMETELTRAQWAAFTGDSPRFAGRGNYPATEISWNDCQRFIDKLNDEFGDSLKGWRFSLPTEARWEYACRAGTTGPAYGELDEIAWYRGVKNGGGPRPVGEKTPNAWGLFDMLGNVAEWCEDCSDLEGATDPSDPGKSWRRAFRGGGYRGAEREIRVEKRDWRGEYYRDDEVGVRLALVPEP
ncbi:MAG: SUMF1/EgtB/PvdO family nonheme iron enzyme [Thermoguttaceae bacterium]|nr:SUMF1/EgtB/PvdO family nonheme iron enzyme [Thermoguttaceae bacterium]